MNQVSKEEPQSPGRPLQKFDVGYENELIGRYEGESPKDAIQACKADLLDHPDFRPDTPIRERLSGLIATPVKTAQKRKSLDGPSLD